MQGEEFVHTELQDGDVWLCNMPADALNNPLFLRYMTLRIGRMAYDEKGEPLNDLNKRDDWLFPVFVKKREYEEVNKE